MADARLQKAKRILTRVRVLVVEQRARLAALEADGLAEAAASATDLLKTYQNIENRCRERVAYLSDQYGLPRPQFRLTATSRAGALKELPAMDTEEAVMLAMDLADTGFDRIVLTNDETGEELHFRPPESKLI